MHLRHVSEYLISNVHPGNVSKLISFQLLELANRGKQSNEIQKSISGINRFF